MHQPSTISNNYNHDDSLKIFSLSKIRNEVDGVTCNNWIDEAAEMLQAQWPRSKEFYAGQFFSLPVITNDDTTKINNNLDKNDIFPCSYLLIDCVSQKCIGHGRLTDCFETSSGSTAAAATYIIVDKLQRGKGVGTILMNKLQTVVSSMNYHYLYLWTQESLANSFYIPKLGYQPTHRVSLVRDCLKQVSVDHVNQLEQLLHSKQQRQQQSSKSKSTQQQKSMETITLLSSSTSDNHDDDDNNQTNGTGSNPKEQDVWLCKRLVESLPSEYISKQERMKQLNDFVHDKNVKNGLELQWYYYINSTIPWQAQVGPSCGLAALRMIADSNNKNAPKLQQQQDDDDDHILPNSSSSLSLLSHAQSLGYTQDGEVFDATHLLQIATSYYTNWSGTMQNLSKIKIMELIRWIQQDSKHHVIIPYDSNPKTKLPCLLHGQHAHYGIIVGFLYNVNSKATTTTTASTELLIPFDMETTLQHSNSLNAESIYLIVQHGLSRQYAIASLSEYIKSNQQLHSKNEIKFASSQSINLANQLVVLSSN